MTINQNTANDNSPALTLAGEETVYGGDFVGQQLEMKKKAEFQPAKFEHSNQRTRALQSPAFFAAFCLWALSLAGMFLAINQFNSPNPRIFASIAAGWAALLLAYISKLQNRDFFKDLALSGTLGALGIALFTAISGYNIPASPSFLMCGALVLTIAFAALLKERYFLTVSGMIALSWSALAITSPEISKYHWLFPALWAVQMSLAVELKAKLPLALITISGVLWLAVSLFILTNEHSLSSLMAVSAMFSFGVAYSRFGKSMQDSHILSGLFQTNIGWGIAALSALLMQDYWLMQTPHIPWTGQLNMPVEDYALGTAWKAFSLLSILTVSLFSAFRMRMNKQTLAGALGVIIFASLLPACIVFKPQILTLTEQYGISAFPVIGLIIGGAITALALGMLANGLRRNKTSMVLLALFTLCSEAVLVMDNLYGEPSNQMIFGFSVLVIALTAGLYAHNGFNRDKEQTEKGIPSYA